MSSKPIVITLDRCSRSPSSAHSKRLLWYSATLALCFMSSGCAISPLAKHTAAFSTAASLVVDNSSSAYRAVIDLHDQEQTSAGVLLIEAGKPWAPHSVQPLISLVGLKTRLDLLAALKTYSQSLSDLTSGLDSKALDTAASSIGSNMKGLSTAASSEPGLAATGISVGSQTANAISTASLALGEFLIAPKIKTALRSTTQKMDPQIEVLCTLLTDDIDTIRKTSKRDYEELLVQQYGFIRDNAAQLSPTDRRAEIEKLPTILKNEQAADAMLADLHKAIATLALTHHALAAAAQGNNPEALQARIADLAAAGQSLGTYYQGLPTQ